MSVYFNLFWSCLSVLSDNCPSVGLVSIRSIKWFLLFVSGLDGRWFMPAQSHCRVTMERCLPGDKPSVYRPVLIVLHIVCENNPCSELTHLRLMIVSSANNTLCFQVVWVWKALGEGIKIQPTCLPLGPKLNINTLFSIHIAGHVHHTVACVAVLLSFYSLMGLF